MQRVLNNRYAERDVKDVEGYVRDTLRGMTAVPVGEQEQLVVRGIFLVERIARALPPEASLEALLHERLGNSLAVYRWRGARHRAEHAAVVHSHAA